MIKLLLITSAVAMAPRTTRPKKIRGVPEHKWSFDILTKWKKEGEHAQIVVARHGVEVTSPGASDLITTQAAFEAFKGFDVTVRTLNPIDGGEERVIEGRLQERTTTDVVINVKGRMVKIPWHLVGEVRLPPAKSE